MARVCVSEFPKGYRPYQKKEGFYMDDLLKQQLDVCIKNVINDWDFTIIITGKGQVRVGKSQLGSQIAKYWASEVERLYKKKVMFSLEHNFIFDGRKLIEKGNYLGEHYSFSPLIFDEAGADLEGRKAMQTITQDVLDYYRECGQYNLLNIIILPEFFDLPKGIAVSRSIFLLDVYFTADEEGNFIRGFFKFYSWRNKKYLYLKGKRDLDYDVQVYDFQGRFYDFYVIDEQGYRKLKKDALKKRESRKRNKFQVQRNAMWFVLNYEGIECKHCGNTIKWTQNQIGIKTENLTGFFVPQTTIGDGVRMFLTSEEIQGTERK